MKIKKSSIKNIANSSKNAQDMQDEIFRSMSADQKIRLTSKFSTFILKINNLHNQNGISKTSIKNLQSFARS